MKLVFSLCILFCSFTLLAQEKQPEEKSENRTVLTVQTVDGETFRGYFVSQNKDFLEIETFSVGVIKIATNRIQKISYSDGKVKTDYYSDEESAKRENINAARYFLGTSAFNYKKGDLYYRNNISSVQYGFSDNFSAGIGTSVIALLGGGGNIYSNLHYTAKINDNIRWKAGVDGIVLIFFGGDAESLFIANTGFTFGKDDLNVTASVLSGLTSASGFSTPGISIAGTARIGNKFALVSENYILPGTISLVSYGIRYIGNKSSFDFGLVNSPEFFSDVFVGIPVVSFLVKL